MTAILYVVDDQWGSHVSAEVMVGICCEPEIAVYQGHKGQGLLMGRELQFLVREKTFSQLHHVSIILSGQLW
jgi:hypothetical protein